MDTRHQTFKPAAAWNRAERLADRRRQHAQNDGRTAAEVADAIYRMRQERIANAFGGYGLAWNTAAAQ